MGALGYFHNDIFDSIRIWNHVEEKALFFSGGLHEDFTIIENGRDDSFHGDSYVLDIREIKLAYMTIKHSFLLDIDDAFIRDDPDIEIVVNPREKTEEPNKNKERVFQESKEACLIRAQEVRKKKCEDEGTYNKEKSKQKKEEKVRKDIEPMTMDYLDNLFVFSLTSEMIAMKCVGHKMFLVTV